MVNKLRGRYVVAN